MKLVSADYSQIELRVLAHMADIPQLRKAFDDGLDIHAMTASEMFGVPIEGMPPEVRRRAKAINFGIIYGISSFGLANQLGISKQEAGDYITTYFKRFPGIRDYMEATKKLAHEQGFVTTLFGRKIHFPEINTKNPSMRGFLERAVDQRADPGLGRRHHPPGDGEDAGRAGSQAPQGDDAAAGARRARLRGAGGRGRKNARPRRQGHGEVARAGAEALGAARRSMPRPRTTGRRRIRVPALGQARRV